MVTNQFSAKALRHIAASKRMPQRRKRKTGNTVSGSRDTLGPGYFDSADTRRISRRLARTLGPVVYVLMQEHGGKCAPEDVVGAAAKARRSSPSFYSYFEWRDSIAAAQFRIEQAKMLLRSITFVAVVDGKPTEAVRMFYNVLPDDGPAIDGRPSAYVALDRLIAEPALNRQVVHAALALANSWAQRYGHYKELRKIAAAITETIRSFKK